MVVGFGSLLLKNPLQYDHSIHALVEILVSPTPTPTESPSVVCATPHLQIIKDTIN